MRRFLLSASFLLPCVTLFMGACAGSSNVKISHRSGPENPLVLSVNPKGRVASVYVRGAVPAKTAVKVAPLSAVAVTIAVPGYDALRGPLICPKSPPGEISTVPLACSHLPDSAQPTCSQITGPMRFSGEVNLSFYCGVIGSSGVFSTNFGADAQFVACLNGASCPESEMASSP